jgi:hypothetical protein
LGENEYNSIADRQLFARFCFMVFDDVLVLLNVLHLMRGTPMVDKV